MRLEPFFSGYGAKYRDAPNYPQPRYDTIIEPFAFTAGYSMRYPERRVILYDLNPIIVGTVNYLIHVSPAEILALPPKVNHVDELRVCQEAKWLIGFWLNRATVQPAKRPGKWMLDHQAEQPGNYWGEAIKERIASQVDQIRHWTIKHASYEDIPNFEATWFIDAPYRVAGKHYKFNQINYPSLAEWCRSRRGQAMVCENAGADWLPFGPPRTVKALDGKRGGKTSQEVLWINDECPTLPVEHSQPRVTLVSEMPGGTACNTDVGTACF